ncbi:MAG: hypothetical protein J7518_21015 [Nocardioidaceae bacterium]|nr:hypothetical protein [Nocardioidaceae bacterium]
MSDTTLVRAWLVAHRALPAGYVAVLVAILFAVWGAVSIQVWGAEREVPLWALAPGTLAMIVGTTFDDQVQHPPPAAPTWLGRARLVWAVTLIGGVTLLAVPVAWALGDPAIARASGVLVAASFVPAVIDLRLGPVLGAALDVLALVYGGKVAADRGMSSVLAQVPGPAWVLVGSLSAFGVLVYVVGRPGPRKWRTHG